MQCFTKLTVKPRSPLHTVVARRALEAIAARHIEEDRGVVPWEQIDGRYETVRRARYVTDWREK